MATPTMKQPVTYDEKLQRLDVIFKELDFLILAESTGKTREALTNANIYLLEVKETYKNSK